MYHLKNNIEQKTHPSSSTPACLSCKHGDVQVGRLFLDKVSCQGAGNAAPNDQDIGSLRQFFRGTVAEEDLRRL